MKVGKFITASTGTLMLVANMTPVLANEISSLNTDTTMQVCQDQIENSAQVINECIDSIEIEKVEPVQETVVYTVENDVTYVMEAVDTEPSVNMEEFMAMYESLMQETQITESEPVDISAQQAAYDQALLNYNNALAEYEAANQMVETTKEVEVEITEEVMDDQGNVSEVTRTEIQTVTEMVPAGDVETALCNLEAAKAELEIATNSLEQAKSQSTDLSTVDTSSDSVQIIEDEVTQITPTTEISQTEVEAKLAELISKYNGSDTWPTIDDHTHYGWMCYNFAHFVFNTLFDRTGTVGSYSTGTEYKFNYPAYDINTLGTIADIQSATELEALLEQAAPGDYIQVRTNTLGGGPHSMICAGIDKINNVVHIFDAFSNASNKARYYTESFATFMQYNDGVSIYRYKGYTPGDYNPKGELESIYGGNGMISLYGWAYDPDDTKSSVDIKVYVGGSKSDSTAEQFTFTTSTTRTDINMEYGLSGMHGFGSTITTKKRGNVPVYVYALNTGAGEDVEIGNSTVYVNHPDGLPFEDVSEDAWYYDVAKECYDTGLVSGTSDSTFSPNQAMTRAMVVTILWRMEGQPKTVFNNVFKDTDATRWYANSISWAVDNGIVHGYGDGTFKPDTPVTREQVAVILANYAQYKGVYKVGSKTLDAYPDGSQVSSYAQAGMKWALSNGIISGNGAGNLNPKKSATRAEGAAMLLRMQKWLA